MLKNRYAYIMNALIRIQYAITPLYHLQLLLIEEKKINFEKVTKLKRYRQILSTISSFTYLKTEQDRKFNYRRR